MRVTIFNTPVVSKILSIVATLFLKITGWKIQGQAPRIPRYILVGAPHTSNWDFIFWHGHRSVHRNPVLPDRQTHTILGTVKLDYALDGRHPSGSQWSKRPGQPGWASCLYFKQHKRLGLIICPEGSRGRTERWRTGFYHMAKNANVPIVLGFLDFKNKTGGFGPIIEPGGDIEKDLSIIQAFYVDVHAKHPECYSPICP